MVIAASNGSHVWDFPFGRIPKSQETIVAIVVAIIGSGGSGVFVTWILSKVDQRHDPLHEGVRELLFCKLEALHRQMVDAGGVASIPLKQSAERIYAAYHGLGGNGTGTSMIQDIRDAHIANTD